MFERIMLPLDGSTEAERILPYVLRLARGLKTPLVVTSVLDAGAPSNLERAKADADGYLKGVVTRLVAEGVEATSVIAVGRPAEEIVRVAERQGCDLIVLSTQGRSRTSRGRVGSVTEKVIHASLVPTLAIPPQEAEPSGKPEVPISSIIVPLDGSPLAETALPYVEDLAQKLPAAVVLAQAVTLRGLYAAALGDVPYVETLAPDAGEADAAAYLSGIADKLQAEGIKVTWPTKRLTV